VRTLQTVWPQTLLWIFPGLREKIRTDSVKAHVEILGNSFVEIFGTSVTRCERVPQKHNTTPTTKN
jgi:hypothetical protein